MTVWFAMKPTSTFLLHVFLFLFLFFFQPAIVDFVNCEQCICVLFTVPQITLFNNFFIKNGSHNTIYTFKNYFATVFSVSVFSFSKNKLNPNTPIYRSHTCSVIYPTENLLIYSTVNLLSRIHYLSSLTSVLEFVLSGTTCIICKVSLGLALQVPSMLFC